MKNYTIIVKQLDYMKHCIGFQPDRVRGRKNRKYEAFRNYFTTSDNDPEWDNLARFGRETPVSIRRWHESASIPCHACRNGISQQDNRRVNNRNGVIKGGKMAERITGS